MTGLKYDAGKAPIVTGFIKYFPRAIIAVAMVSQYGFDKYKAWGGWVTVPDGAARYADGEGRHLVNQFIDGPLDPESKRAHLAHKAWNSMAVLELALLEEERKNESPQDPAEAGTIGQSAG